MTVVKKLPGVFGDGDAFTKNSRPPAFSLCSERFSFSDVIPLAFFFFSVERPETFLGACDSSLPVARYQQ